MFNFIWRILHNLFVSTLIQLGGILMLLSYITSYNFLVTYPHFMKFDDFSLNLSGIKIPDLFSKLNWFFWSVSTFSRPGDIFFAYVFYDNDKHILEHVSRI